MASSRRRGCRSRPGVRRGPREGRARRGLQDGMTALGLVLDLVGAVLLGIAAGVTRRYLAGWGGPADGATKDHPAVDCDSRVGFPCGAVRPSASRFVRLAAAAIRCSDSAPAKSEPPGTEHKTRPPAGKRTDDKPSVPDAMASQDLEVRDVCRAAGVTLEQFVRRFEGLGKGSI